MAKQTTVHLIDDIDGSPAAETVQFGIDGRAFEIDLTEVHVKELRDLLDPFITAGRRASSGSAPRSAKPTPARERIGDIRRWAREQGIPIADRGRIASDIRARYEAEHGVSA